MKFNKKLISIIFLIFIFHAKVICQDTSLYELETEKEKLNNCYRKIMNKLNLLEQIKFKKAQRQWAIFRDLDCIWASEAGTIGCLIDRTDNRIEELRETNFIDNDNNFMSIKSCRSYGGNFSIPKTEKLKDSDKKLNEIYKIIMNKLVPAEQIKLRKAQRQWIVFRDFDCAWESNRGLQGCLVVRTNIRIKQLKETYFFDKENNYFSIEYGVYTKDY